MKFKNGSFKLIGITQGNNIVESAHWLKHQTLMFVTVESQTNTVFQNPRSFFNRRFFCRSVDFSKYYPSECSQLSWSSSN